MVFLRKFGQFPPIGSGDKSADKVKFYSLYSVVTLRIRSRSPKTCLRFYVCYLQVLKGSDQKQLRKGGDIIFPIISQWGLSLAMETRVLIQSVPNPHAAFRPPQ